MHKKITITFIALLLATLVGMSQQDSSGHKKIGLVLSGGGAKCLSQIGVLRVLEEHGIELDYIAGTSMGAIIGSMYAMGYTVDEIEQYLREVDWDALLSNKIPRNRLGYFDRKTESRYLLTLPIRDGKIELPSGFNGAYYMHKQLCFLTQQSTEIESFADFPIPFLCVATDLENGQMRIFEDGSLTDALRASSAFPSLFTPYELDSHLYVDGGIVNNYPVVPLKDKGIDYIIGVDVQDLLYTKDQLNSVVRILEQTSSFMNAAEYEKQLELTHILIKPDIKGVSITDFDQFDILVSKGEEAARQMLPELIALSEKNKGKKVDSIAIIPLPTESFYLNTISIEGLSKLTREFILGKLRVKENQTFTIQQLDKGLDRLYGSKYYKNISYELIKVDTAYNLLLRVVEDPSQIQFRIGLHYDDDFKTALLLNYTQRNLLLKNSRFTVDFALGDNIRSDIQYFVDRGAIPSPGIKLRTTQFETKVYESGNPILALNYSDISLSVFLQTTIGDVLAIGTGVQFEGIDLSQDVAATKEDDTYQNYLNYYAFLDFDSFNRANYPMNGTKTSLNARVITKQDSTKGFIDPSSVIDFSFAQAISITNRIALIPSLKGIFTIGPDLDYAYNVFLGSMGKNYINYITPFIGYNYMEIPGRNAIVLRADANFQIFKKHYIIAKANWGKVEKSFQETIDSDLILDGYSIGYSYDSIIGPLELSVTGSTNHSDVYTYISLGFWF